MVHLRIRAPWKRKIIFQTIIFRFYVKLRGCIWLCIPVRPSRLFLTKTMDKFSFGFFFWPPFTTTQKGKQYHRQTGGKSGPYKSFYWYHYITKFIFLVRKSFQILSYLNLILLLFLPISIIQLMGRRQLLQQAPENLDLPRVGKQFPQLPSPHLGARRPDKTMSAGRFGQVSKMNIYSSTPWQ